MDWATTALVHCYLSRGIDMEIFSCSLGVAMGNGLFRQLRVSSHFEVFFFVFILFLLCAFLTSRLVLKSMLLQSLDVFGTILIVIYSLKKCFSKFIILQKSKAR